MADGKETPTKARRSSALTLKIVLMPMTAERQTKYIEALKLFVSELVLQELQKTAYEHEQVGTER